jgi:chromosome partitioning protein
MGAVIAIMNRKGGVGKTTTTVALADTIVSEFKRSVVVIDLDPQASASLALAKHRKVEDRTESGENLVGLLRAWISTPGVDPAPFTIGSVNRIKHQAQTALALLASSDHLWDLEDEHSGQHTALHRAMVGVIEALRGRFDYVIVDSPPGRSITSEAALREADLVLCPTVADRLSAWGLDSFAGYLRRRAPEGWSRARFLVTRYRERLTEHKTTLNSLAQRTQEQIALLRGEAKGAAPPPLTIREDKRFVERLDSDKIRTLQGFYGQKAARDLVAVANAIQRELETDAQQVHSA